MTDREENFMWRKGSCFRAIEDPVSYEDVREGSFAQYCDGWIATNRMRLKESSRARYKADIENHIKPFFGELQPSEIASEDVDDFSQMLLYKKQLSAKTVRNILALFQAVFSYAGKRGGGRQLPALEVIYPKEQKKAVRVLNEEEETRLMCFLAKEMDLCKFGVYLALRTGLRIGEICALKWSDISRQADTISVCRTVQRIPTSEAGSYAKTEIVIGLPKTDSSCRIIPLMPDLSALCERFDPMDPKAFVLTGTRCCMEPRKLQRRLKKYTEECQIKEVHFHTLRHTFATRCIEAGFDVKTLSEILGHSNISVTLNQYVHPNLELKRENMNRLKISIYI